MTYTFYIIKLKGLELKLRDFWRLIPIFEEVEGEKLTKEGFAALPLPWIVL